MLCAAAGSAHPCVVQSDIQTDDEWKQKQSNQVIALNVGDITKEILKWSILDDIGNPFER